MQWAAAPTVLLACVLGSALTTVGCRSLVQRQLHADGRIELPPPQPLPKSKQMPGAKPDALSIEGMWSVRHRQQAARIEEGVHGLYYGIFLRLHPGGAYDLTYMAQWGGRAMNDPQFAGVQVRESGRYSIAGDILFLEPQTTRHTRKIKGNRNQQIIDNDNRAYVARIDKGFLNLAGPCAPYQVEPVCRETRTIWYPMRYSAGVELKGVPDL